MPLSVACGGEAEPSAQPSAGAAGQSVVCAGRRPEGLSIHPLIASSELGAFFARVACLEAASVEAFDRLHDELARVGAPDELRFECLASAADEVRHASQMAELAVRFGGEVQGPQIAPQRPRSLLELAVENAVEGCVRETYGALEASFQAEHAGDGEVRAVMAGVARDETAHAALSWRLHAWLEDRLSVEEWRQVERAMGEAILELRGELRAPRASSLLSVAGLPDEDTALALLDGLSERLWHEPRLVA